MEIDWFIFGAQIVNFLILLFLLRRFLYGPIVEAMEERERRIAARLAAAEKREAEAEREAAAHRRQQEAFEATRDRMMAEARDRADEERRKLVEAARKEVNQVESRWRDALHQEHDQALARLRQRAGTQIVSAARTVLHDLADASLEDQVLTSFLGRLRDQTLVPEQVREAKVRSAFALSEAQRAQLRSALAAQTGEGEPALRFIVAEELVCGLELRGTGWKVEWSVEAYLQDLERRVSAMLEELYVLEEAGRAGPAAEVAS